MSLKHQKSSRGQPKVWSLLDDLYHEAPLSSIPNGRLHLHVLILTASFPVDKPRRVEVKMLM
jgi:hypothetical protein